MQLGLTAWLSATHGAVGAAIGAGAGASIGAMLLALAGRRLLALPLPGGELARIGAATAIMAAAVIACPGAHTTIGLFQSAVLGMAVYAAAAIALNVMARELALFAVRTATRRIQPITSPANAD
ncbi:MAG: hypothetical protein IPG56_09145 [Caulobacteraceae bacterium]|nr:hypothetical protein [Caulobacteraceae bacterium]